MNDKLKTFLSTLLILVVIACLWNIPLLNTGKLVPMLGGKEINITEIQWTEFSLGRKAIIDKDKYGYRKKLSFEEPVMISQFLEWDYDLEDVYYGIYRDKELTDPVFEVDYNYQLKAEAELEEGADLAQYPEYNQGYCLKLEPGTYYAGLYTKKIFEFDTAKFVTRYSPAYSVIALDEAVEQPWYYIKNASRQLYFQITPEKSGTVTLDLEYNPLIEKIQLCDKEQKTIGTLGVEKGNIASFFAEADETYYIYVKTKADVTCEPIVCESTAEYILE